MHPGDVADMLYAAVDAKDMPGMTDVDASLLYFCSLVKKQNKVTLTGECADETSADTRGFTARN